MEKLPTVSVIVPVYKVEAYIRQCAASLFEQTWENIQYIFVDDGSPDRSIDILMATLSEHPERESGTIIIKQENRGLPAARMAGLAKADGDYIIHVDPDDWVEPDYISSLVEKAIEEDADVVYCDYFKEYDGKPAKIEREQDFHPDDGKVAVKAMHNSIIRAYMWNKLVKKELYDLEKMIVPEYGYHEDIVFQTQILYGARKCRHLGRPLYHYRRRRKGALTGSSLIRTRKHSAANMLALYDALPKDRGPVTDCGIDILLRGGWYSCIILDFKLLLKYPEAVKVLSEMDYIKDCRVPVGKQAYTKMCCEVLRLFARWI
ncbi:MAG: glycosyltransferase [Bacteroidales bacterium]|nr:glycosyltransferase [Bacteroidales bacterium]